MMRLEFSARLPPGRVSVVRSDKVRLELTLLKFSIAGFSNECVINEQIKLFSRLYSFPDCIKMWLDYPLHVSPVSFSILTSGQPIIWCPKSVTSFS